MSLLPDLSPNLQTFVRAGYGVLMLLTLAWAWPHRRRFFLSERWGGYAESQRIVDWVQNPVLLPLVLTVWVAAAAALATGVWVVAAALVNLLLCRYFFVQMRWKGLLRGMGAPGFMSYWLGAVVLLLELSSRYAPDVRRLALLVAQVDFALIMLSAGIYKSTDGYASNVGMDIGMANPQWGYWWRICRSLRPRHWTFALLNHAAWTTEVAAGLFMLIPSTRAVGGLVIAASFAFVWTQIRLAWLTEMLVLCGLLFIPPGHVVDRWIGTLIAAPAASAPAAPGVGTFFAAALWIYLVLLPVAHAGLFYNFYARRRLPSRLQRALERYTNFFGIIIWRVFSPDHLNFFVRIYEQERTGGHRRLLSRYGSARSWRFSHVAESIVVTTIFTTLKYYASNASLFEERLRRYARTLTSPTGCLCVFEYVSIRTTAGRYEYVPAVEYVFDPADQSLRVGAIDAAFDVHAAHATSVVHEGASPGSYAPAV